MELPGSKNQHFSICNSSYFIHDTKFPKQLLNICTAYREGIIWESTVQKWVAKLKKDDFHLDERSRSGPSSKFYKDRFKGLIKEEGRQHLEN